ncbi:hypothetical protein LB542_19795 [Mesorhizobium sp. BR1-1-9]|uniref:hypothetical protein n=1 Tax=Mesorhizobium sp. BR1-1-9 TaxID=2876646 RepID=UPI001CD09CF8|nr:hypothetical protein [Mesorhizobium sp. BR1-1-9]MBZ9873094.1 hypothetical protein [Mesorhizobium sp. BR1-1-9]
MSVRPDAVSRVVSSAASTNATSAKAAPAQLYSAVGYNTAAAVLYLKFYDKASAPTVGTDTPKMTLPLPPASGFSFSFPTPFEFKKGLAYALTALAADADTTALVAADVVGLNVIYT